MPESTGANSTLETRPRVDSINSRRQQQLAANRGATQQSVRDNQGGNSSVGAYTKQQDRARREALAGLVKATYEDDTGRKWLVLVPPAETDLSRGIVQGPPDTTELNLPERVAVRLHNELFNRGLITKTDVRGRAMEVHAALQAAYHVDTTAILNLY